MTNMKSTKRALLTSVMALFLCFTMLLGTTFAWFTDSVTSAGNKIIAGELDIELWMYDGTNYVEITDESAPIFGASNDALANANTADTIWEPGKTQVVYLAIKNAGNLDLKYQVALEVKDVVNDLTDVVKYSITPDATPANPVSDWSNGLSVVKGVNATAATNVVLEAEAEHYFALSVHMDEEAGNQYMNGSISFDIKVLATQLNSEEDSFGPNYDASATYPTGVYTIPSAIVAATADNTGVVTIANDDNTFTVQATANEGTEVKATIAPTNSTTAAFEIAEATQQKVASYDIAVTGQNAGSEVIVDLFVGKNLNVTAVYHNGVAMDEADYSYRPETGYVTIKTIEFSPFEIIYTAVNDLPLAKVTKLDVSKVNATLGMNNKNSVEEYNLGVAYKFATTQTYEEAANSKYADYHADFVVSSNKEIPANAVALLGYYAAYCDGYNDGNWVALQSDEAIPANKEIRLLDVLFGGDGTGMANGFISYHELCNSIPEFDCGVAGLSDDLAGTTITVELRVYETKDPADTETNTKNEETGTYYTVCTYKYSFN